MRSPTAPGIELACRALQERQLPQALQLSQALNWPYRLEDWRDALRLGNGLAVETAGHVVATALWWLWGERYGSCGMIIVDPRLQGRGMGRALMHSLLQQVGDRTVLLRSTVAGKRLYEQLDFEPIGIVHQHQGMPASPQTSLTVAAAAKHVRWTRPDEMTALLALDCEASGCDRHRLLEALMANGRVAVFAEAAPPSGYACIRRWGRGYVIGPVVASEPDHAKALIAMLLQTQPGQFIRLDVTEESGLSPWLVEIGIPCVDSVTSMARGVPPPRSARRMLYALANQSLG